MTIAVVDFISAWRFKGTELQLHCNLFCSLQAPSGASALAYVVGYDKDAYRAYSTYKYKLPATVEQQSIQSLLPQLYVARDP